MKKKYMILASLFLPCLIYAFEIGDIQGVWVEKQVYDFMIQKREKIDFKQYDSFKFIEYSSVIIDFDKTNNTGIYILTGLAPLFIKQIDKLTETNFKIDTYYVDYLNGENVVDSNSLDYVYIHFIDDSTILIDNGWEFLQTNDTPWYRISGLPKIPIQNAKINDTRVRLRTKPDLVSDVWGYLNTGDRIKIIDKSEEKEKIGDMEAYWYKVQTEGYPDGWVYGAYVTIE